MNIDQIIERLKSGNDNFVNNKLEGKLQDGERRATQVSGQAPDTIVLSCADSRVVPELAFDTGIGELFVVRVAGNVANTSSIASMEYAVAHLGSQVLLVMGHESCGAVTAAIAGGDNGANLNHLLAHVNPAIEKAPANSEVNDVVKVNAQSTADELVAKSEIIRNAVNEGKLKIIPTYYNLGSGKVDFLD
jgi:carbonic anhydrase